MGFRLAEGAGREVWWAWSWWRVWLDGGSLGVVGIVVAVEWVVMSGSAGMSFGVGGWVVDVFAALFGKGKVLG